MRDFLILGVFWVLGISTSAQGVDRWKSVIEGPFSYSLHMPLGWDNDATAAHDMVIDLALHPDSIKWSKAPIVMYSKVTMKQSASQSLDDVIALDLQSFLKNAPLATARELRRLNTFPQGRPLIIYSIEDNSQSNFERIAYVDAGEYVVMLVMGTREEHQIGLNEAAFLNSAQRIYVIR